MQLDAELLQPRSVFMRSPLKAPSRDRGKRGSSSIDFTPRLDSTPEETSTARAPVTRTASATLSGVQAARQQPRQRHACGRTGTSSRRPSHCRRARCPRRHRTSAGRRPRHRPRCRARRRRPAPTLITFITGLPVRALMAATRSGVSRAMELQQVDARRWPAARRAAHRRDRRTGRRAPRSSARARPAPSADRWRRRGAASADRSRSRRSARRAATAASTRLGRRQAADLGLRRS